MKPETMKEEAAETHVCEACGGMVDANGYAMGGEVIDENVGEGDPDTEETAQERSRERLRHFAEAVKVRR